MAKREVERMLLGDREGFGDKRARLRRFCEEDTAVVAGVTRTEQVRVKINSAAGD